MRRNFFILIFLFFIFSILNANPLKNETELQKFRNKVDKVIKEELKNDYKKEYLKRKDNLKKIENNGEIGFEDEDFIFQFEDNALILASKKLKSIPNTAITQEFDKNGNTVLGMILSKDLIFETEDKKELDRSKLEYLILNNSLDIYKYPNNNSKEYLKVLNFKEENPNNYLAVTEFIKANKTVYNLEIFIKLNIKEI